MTKYLWCCVLLTVCCSGSPSSQEPDQQLSHLNSIQQRIESRTFPSVFQAWNAADNLPQENKWTTMARHDLVFHGIRAFGLEWDNVHQGLATGVTPESIPEGLTIRRDLLAKNPNIVLIAEIRYRDAGTNYLPENHEWWLRNEDGSLAMGWEEGGFIKIDFSNPDYQAAMAARAAAVVQSGVFDGIMVDWWRDEDRLELIQTVREAIGPDAIILANANDRTTPLTAPYINGFFMECYRSESMEQWQQIAESLVWAEQNLRRPVINCLESWFHESRQDLHLMRLTTTMSLTLSNGCALFSDPNPLPTGDHLHNWYPFWNRGLGTALAPGEHCTDGSVLREFTNGAALYNPAGNADVTVTFPEERTSRATGQRGRTHTVPGWDGDIFEATE
jgi:hypothetical protein